MGVGGGGGVSRVQSDIFPPLFNSEFYKNDSESIIIIATHCRFPRNSVSLFWGPRRPIKLHVR